MKFKTTKFNSVGLIELFTKIFTHENNPLYSILHTYRHEYYNVRDYTDWKRTFILSLSLSLSLSLRISTPTADRTPPSFKRESSSDVEKSPHSYANVTFAFEVARGRSPRSGSPRSGSPRSGSPRSVSPRKRNPDSSLLIQQQRR